MDNRNVFVTVIMIVFVLERICLGSRLFHGISFLLLLSLFAFSKILLFAAVYSVDR